MKYLKCLLLSSLLWVTLSLAEIKQIGNDTIEMSVDDYRFFIEQSEELRIIKENQQNKMNYYLGVNVGTYGVGVGAGIVL